MVSAESSGGIEGEEEMRGLHFKLRLLLAFLAALSSTHDDIKWISW